MSSKNSKTLVKLFEKLANPDKNGFSRWVSTDEFVGEYKDLKLGNGFAWGRSSSAFAKKYIIETDKTLTPGNSIDRIRLNGFNTKQPFNQGIRADIRQKLSKEKCVMLGVCGVTENTQIEIDHKNGRKDDARVSNLATQREEDFQPLCKAANDIKRQICKECKLTNKRWNAQNIRGNPYPFYAGDEDYTAELGCVGCYQYDPVEYRVKTIQMAIQNTMTTLYGNDPDIMKRLNESES